MERKQFFIVGIQRCGTTYAATLMDEHPEICMARPFSPEPKFFILESEFRLGSNHYERSYYREKNAKIFGEKTIHYAGREDAARRIREWYPGAKIVIMVRDPVRRALSNYFFSVEGGLETRTLEEVFGGRCPPPPVTRRVHLDPFDYLGRGKYIDTVRLYRSFFDSEKIRVVVLEHFAGNARAVEDLYRFLDVDDSFIPKSIDRKINASIHSGEMVSATVLKTLRTHFREPNRLLAEECGVDVSPWEGARR